MEKEILQKMRWFRNKSEPIESINRTLIYTGKTFSLINCNCLVGNKSFQYIIPLSEGSPDFCNLEFLEYLLKHPVGSVQELSEDSTNINLLINNTLVLKISPRQNGLKREYEILSSGISGCKNVPKVLKEFYIENTQYAFSMEVVPGVSAWDHFVSHYDQKQFNSFLKVVAVNLALIHISLKKSYGSNSATTQNIETELNSIIANNLSGTIACHLEKDAQFQVCHGDFHLGQIIYDLRTNNCVIIDFEGEPTQDPLKNVYPLEYDIACMYRSISYLNNFVKCQQNSSISYEIFLESYLKIANKANITISKHLIEKFLLIRCNYEIGYEAKNRPHLAWIPQRDLNILLSQL